jgi:inner membrane transporter RhtA
VAVLAVLAGMISVQAGASLAKTLFPVVGAEGTSAMRLVWATLILCGIWRPWRQRLDRAAVRSLLRFGAALGLMNLTFYLAVQRLPLGIAVAIEFTGPLAVAVLASRRAVDFGFAALAAMGIALILPLSEGATALDPWGVAWALVAATCWGLYIVFGQRAGAAMHGGTATSVGMLVAALVVLPFGIAGAGRRLLDPSLVPLGIAVAVLSSAVPYSLDMVGLKRLPAQTFGVLMSIEPALAALAGLVFLHERLTIVQVAAIACVMAASLGSTLTAPARPPAADPVLPMP